MKSYGKINRVYGVDFSEAKDAGKRIWIARGAVEGTPIPHLAHCVTILQLKLIKIMALKGIYSVKIRKNPIAPIIYICSFVIMQF